MQVYPAEAPNNTNIDEVIKQATANDPELQDINLNNLKYISKEKWAALFAALKDNSVVECLSACNCDMTDTIANFLCECLEVSTIITFWLNLFFYLYLLSEDECETFYVKGFGLVYIFCLEK